MNQGSGQSSGALAQPRAAVKLFTDSGFEAETIEAICHAAGVRV
jgi:hypothetical protein